jgi:hypothetical protein
MIGPESRLLHPLVELALTVLPERRNGFAGETDVASLAGFGGFEDPAPLRFGERAAYLQTPGFEVQAAIPRASCQ